MMILSRGKEGPFREIDSRVSNGTLGDLMNSVIANLP